MQELGEDRSQVKKLEILVKNYEEGTLTIQDFLKLDFDLGFYCIKCKTIEKA